MGTAPLTDDELDLVLAEVFGSCWDTADARIRDHHRGNARRGLAAITAPEPPVPGPIRVSDDEVDVVLGELFGDEWRCSGEDVRDDRRWELRYGLAIVNDRRMPRGVAA